MDDPAFFRVLADGFDVDADEFDLVLVDVVGGPEFDCAVRVGMLARLLSAGQDWDDVAEATGFALQPRAATRTPGRLLVEVGDHLMPLDIFAVADDPLGAVVQMFQDARDFL